MSPESDSSNERDHPLQSGRSDEEQASPEVRIERAKSFDGFVVLEGEKIVAVAFSREKALALIDMIRAELDPEDET